MWPANYGGHSKSTLANAYTPAAGHLWDLAAKKKLRRVCQPVEQRNHNGCGPGVGGLLNHVSPKFKLPGMRDTDNVGVFFKELD